MRIVASLFTAFLLAASIASAQGQWIPLNGPRGGKVSIAVADSSGNFFAATGRGIYRWTDEGTSWRLVSSGPPPLPLAPVSAMVVTPANTLLCVAPPILNYNGRLMRSTDAGATWSLSDEGIESDIRDHSVAVSRSGNWIALSTATGIYRSTDDGLTWRQVSPLTFVWYITESAGDLYFWGNGNAYRLPGGDGTDTIGIAPIPNHAVSSAICAVDGTLFLNISNAPIEQKGFYRSTDRGTSWTKTSIPAGEIVRVSRIGGDRMLAVGAKTYQSTDRGATWSNIEVLADTTFDASSISNGTALLSSSMGALVSTDNGASFSHTDSGMAAHTITSIVPGRGQSLHAFTTLGYAGDSAFGLFRSNDAGASWNRIDSGLTFSNQSTFAVVEDTLYAFQLTRLLRSTDGGVSWQLQSISPLVVDFLFARDSLLIGVDGDGNIIESSNGGRQWSSLSSTLQGIRAMDLDWQGRLYAATTSGLYYSVGSARNWTPDGARGDIHTVRCWRGTVAAATRDSVFVVEPNDSSSWKGYVPPNMTPHTISSMCVDGNGTIYIVATSGVYYTVNHGLRWFQFNTGLTSKAATIAAAPNGQVYCGTIGGGVYRRDYAAGIPRAMSLPGVMELR